MRPPVLAAALACLIPHAAWPQESPPASPAASEFLIDNEHPRLLLPQRRLRLLRRERERETLRWNQFHTFMAGGAEMPERGFADALYYSVAGSETHGRQAITWALSASATDLRQLALVYDWCHAVLTPQQRARLETKLKDAVAKTAAASDIPTIRSRLLAAVALSTHARPLAEQTIQSIAEKWWKSAVVSRIEAKETPFALSDHYPLLEIFHVLRDNLDIDLRESAAKFFTTLPVFHLLSHYPAPYPAPENDYRIPLMAEHAAPDLRDSVYSRAAALAMVAYDSNSTEMQFLQGWLIHDKYVMRSPFGITYEFLWANPYQPGLSYHYLPNVFYDPPTGRLIVRSTWEDNAVWLYQRPGLMQMFRDGKIVNMKQESVTEPIAMGNTVLLPANLSRRFSVNAGEEPARYYLIGLKPDSAYEIEVEDEDMAEVISDRGGVIELTFPANRRAAALLRERSAAPATAP
jgi:hypothetical protein